MRGGRSSDRRAGPAAANASRRAHGAIADRVDGDRQTAAHRATDDRRELVAGDELEPAAGLRLVRLEQRCGLRSQRSVCEQLERAGPERVVARAARKPDRQRLVERAVRQVHEHAKPRTLAAGE